MWLVVTICGWDLFAILKRVFSHKILGYDKVAVGDGGDVIEIEASDCETFIVI